MEKSLHFKKTTYSSKVINLPCTKTLRVLIVFVTPHLSLQNNHQKRHKGWKNFRKNKSLAIWNETGLHTKTRPQCSLNRAVKLMVTCTVQLRFCYCFYLYANVQLMKRDIVIAVIYCYITTDFHYVKRDSRLLAWGGVMLQRVGIKKNVNRHFSLNF